MHSNMAKLEPLIGEWEMEATVDGEVMMRGTCMFSWSDEGPYLVQTADGAPTPDGSQAWRENLPFPTVAITGYDDGFDNYSVLYSDARGVQRVYAMTFADGILKQWRDMPGFKQRFTGELSGDGSRIDARWERSEDGEDWFLDFELTYTRVG
jgi:hypothetical protein